MHFRVEFDLQHVDILLTPPVWSLRYSVPFHGTPERNRILVRQESRGAGGGGGLQLEGRYMSSHGSQCVLRFLDFSYPLPDQLLFFALLLLRVNIFEIALPFIPIFVLFGLASVVSAPLDPPLPPPCPRPRVSSAWGS